MLLILAIPLFFMCFISIFVLSALRTIEDGAIRTLIPLVFEKGIKVYKHTIELADPYYLPEADTIIKMNEGKFKFITDKKVYFISQFFWFKPFRINTPFQLNVIGIIDKDKIVITAKLPLISFLYTLNLATFVLTGVCIFCSFCENIWYSLFGLVGFATIVFLFRQAFLVEKERIKIMINELAKIISDRKVKFH